MGAFPDAELLPAFGVESTATTPEIIQEMLLAANSDEGRGGRCDQSGSMKKRGAVLMRPLAAGACRWWCVRSSVRTHRRRRGLSRRARAQGSAPVPHLRIRRRRQVGLIGRPMRDSRSRVARHLEADSSPGSAGDRVDLRPADGLKAEREQGITIDVAYRYFSTAKRKFIIADTLGHEQHTGTWSRASTCQLAIILIDARPESSAEQTLQLHRQPAGYPQCRSCDQQDGSRRLEPGALQ